jgi:coenzyme F420-0:L-glutamate ligase / coenzyme F420-1:gamma-L-glutamate ligase
VSTDLTVSGVDGVPEVRPGDDLAAMLVRHVPDLCDGDIVVVTSKVVSKAEGRTVRTERLTAIDAETARVIARRGPTTIARTAHGLTLAAAGVDASNVEPGTVVLLPADPDASARSMRSRVRELAAANVAVVVTDTAGRPWREGQTDIAVGCAGLVPLDDHEGRYDRQGNLLSVTAPAVADEVASAADLVMGKVSNRPFAVVRGLQDQVLPARSDGPGARALIRPDDGDMFALGAREAAVAVVLRDDPQDLAALAALASSAAPVDVTDLVARAAGEVESRLDVRALRDDDDDGDDAGSGAHREVEVSGAFDVAVSAALERICALAVVHGWQVVTDDRNLGLCRIVLRCGTPNP